MIDGRITRLVCDATVVAAAGDAGQAAALAEGVLKTELPRALPAALERVLADDPTVYVARSLRCEVRAGPAVTGEALARSIAAQIGYAVRDPARDGTGLVRFASTADYVAAFLAALARGDAWRRWYFSPLRRLSGMDVPAVFLALAAEGNDIAHVMLALKRSGELGRVVSAVGEDALAQAWPPPERARPQQAEWLSLIRLALDLADTLGRDIAAGLDLQATATQLAQGAEQDLDWTNPVELARALAAAVRLVSAPAVGAVSVSADQLPRWLDWADADELAQGLSVPPRRTPAAAPTTSARPPRTLAVEAALSRIASRGGAIIDRRSPAATSIMLWTALAEEMPELAGATWARDTVRRFVDRHLAGHTAPPGGTTIRRSSAEVACAGIYLLLRTLDAMRMPALCRRAGVPAVPLLHALVRRWAGPVDVAEALRPVADDTRPWRGSLTGDRLQLLQAEVTRLAVAQQSGADEIVRLRAVPFGGTAMAAILGDADDLMWLGGQLQNSADAANTLVERWREVADEPAFRVEHPPGDADDPGRAILLADLAAMAHAHDDEPEADLPLDLIALTVLRHWARWLRGFSTASVPYLLSTFVRRPGRLAAADDGTLRVSLSRLPHDIVLETSGCLDSFELRWPWVPGQGAVAACHPPGLVRQVEFTMEVLCRPAMRRASSTSPTNWPGPISWSGLRRRGGGRRSPRPNPTISGGWRTSTTRRWTDTLLLRSGSPDMMGNRGRERIRPRMVWPPGTAGTLRTAQA